jgi:hypothetical protein
LYRLAQDTNITVIDVPPVLPQVDNDTIGPCHFGHNRGGHRVGKRSFSGFSQSSHVIYLNR